MLVGLGEAGEGVRGGGREMGMRVGDKGFIRVDDLSFCYKDFGDSRGTQYCCFLVMGSGSLRQVSILLISLDDALCVLCYVLIFAFMRLIVFRRFEDAANFRRIRRNSPLHQFPVTRDVLVRIEILGFPVDGFAPVHHQTQYRQSSF